MKIYAQIIFCMLLLIGCTKDKTCGGVDMLEGEKSFIIGRWNWYKTRMEEWFDVGNSNWYDITPQSEGFEYHFDVTADGKYLGFRNDTLIFNFLMTNSVEELNGNTINYVLFNVDCGEIEFIINQNIWNQTNDSIFTNNYPLSFNDPENHLKSHKHYFVKE